VVLKTEFISILLLNLIAQQLASYMARLILTASRDNYLLTVSARQDGSSVRAEGHKIVHGIPSAAFAWRISKRRIQAWYGVGINDLKIRIGCWFKQVISAIAPYATQGRPSFTFFIFLYFPALAGSIPYRNFSNRNCVVGKKRSI
jgi:hypothetical protein